MKKALLWLWQLPQNILGLLLLLYLKGETKHSIKGITIYYQSKFPGGITLGEYIILGTKDDISVKHEYGHVIQSRYLGPLYLLVIGIPSLLHAWLHDCQKHNKTYYHFYTEVWADKLGGVIRK